MPDIVTITNEFPKAAVARLQERFDVHYNATGTPFSEEELAGAAGVSAALITYLSDKIGAGMIEKGQKLKIIANYGAGYNNIDVAAARARGVWVANTPGVLHETTADLTWAMLLAASRRLAPADRFTRQGQFHGWGAGLFLGHDVFGKTLGIIGCGEIGQAVARRALGFRMRVLYHQRNRLPEKTERELGAEFVALDKLLRDADFVSLHVPLTAATRHMIGDAQLALMKPTAYLVHAARGKVVDDRALVRALREGRIAGAALDVYEDEPVLTAGMTELDNLLLLPHIGSASHETRDKMAHLVVDNVIDALDGRTPRSLVPDWNG
ncbi:MAG: 2-hydroxyacid dehydrogenase [Nitrospinaceae bacterium]